MIKKNKQQLKSIGKTVRIDTQSGIWIANRVIQALSTMNSEQKQLEDAARQKKLEEETLQQKFEEAVRQQKLEEARRNMLQQTAYVTDPLKMRILMVSSLNGESLWRIEQLIAEQLRLLAKEVVSIKAYQNFSSELLQLNPDLLLVVGNEEPLTESDLDIIRRTPLKKAIWLSDNKFTSESTGQLAALFDYVFTQNTLHLPFYQHCGCKKVHYLPFAADRGKFAPSYVKNDYRSNILLLGNVQGRSLPYIQEIRHVFHLHKVYAAGSGWEAYPELSMLQPDAELPEYINGAEIIIHWGQSQSRIFDIAACGAFQLAEAHPNIYEYMNPEEDIVTFHNQHELLEKLHYYLTHPESKRLIASRGLWNSTYHYSFLQMAAKLLYMVCNR